jgi:peroxidase
MKTLNQPLLFHVT